MQETLTPEQLANKLVGPLESIISIPKPITQIPFDLEMLHKAYSRTQDQMVGQAARDAFQKALKDWTDVEIKEFLCKWLFDQPHSTQLEKVSMDKRRELFQKIYHYVFEGQIFLMNIE